jgi:hypothetical protein
MMEFICFLTGWLSGIITTGIILLWAAHKIRKNARPAQGKSKINSIMEGGESVVAVLNPDR